MEAKSNNYDYYFEPFCQWQIGESYDTLRVHLQGFNKDQINVKVDCHKILIAGEREYGSEGGMSPTGRKRFCKEIRLGGLGGREYKLSNIQTKFEEGVLSLVLPLKQKVRISVRADQLGLTKLVSRLNITKKAALEFIVGVSFGLVVAIYMQIKHV